MTDLDLFRVYLEAELDGYPREWASVGVHDVDGKPKIFGIKEIVREQAGHRCVRCGHPYVKGEGSQWSRCDEHCTHRTGQIRFTDGVIFGDPILNEQMIYRPDDEVAQTAGELVAIHGYGVEAEWRILTVHHLNERKFDCRWHNLVSLCQRCHLTIQRKVEMNQVWPFEHSDWFKPYAAAFYAYGYLGEELTREQTMARLDELLALERVA